MTTLRTAARETTFHWDLQNVSLDRERTEKTSREVLARLISSAIISFAYMTNA